MYNRPLSGEKREGDGRADGVREGAARSVGLTNSEAVEAAPPS